ncbi:hypothetical protein [Kitasatospora sp. NPDC057500]|uniref:hypothetical protein n=1 Tax=Kitasatospora sp. NPDC057500 TaxID=3346151 RepID=UPI00368BF1CB
MPLVSGKYPVRNPESLLNAGAQPRSNLPRHAVVSDFAILTSQVMLSTALYLQASDTVTSLTFKSGSTAADTPTNWWYALYDDAATPALIGQSADQLTAAWAANTAKTLPLQAPAQITRTGIYHAAIMVKATAPPSLLGAATLLGAVAGYVAGDVPLTRSSGAALTTTAPATIAAPTPVAYVPRVVAL